MTSTILMIYLLAVSNGVDPRLALSIAYNESGFNPNAIGSCGDIGLFQVRHQLVDESLNELFDAETNTKVALKLLKEVKVQCNSLGDAWFLCYNRGVTGAKKLAHPFKTDYYLKVSATRNCLKRYTYRDLVRGNVECFK